MKSIYTGLLFAFFCLQVGAVSAQSATETSLRVMTYNIRNARGLDDKVDYERVAAIILREKPHVVALQEVDSVTGRSEGVDVLACLAGLTGMYAVYGASIDFDGGKYGIGVLSREKPVAWRRIPLPGREEARSLLLVEFSNYVFGCTHFSLTEADRLASVPLINAAMKDYDKPAFLAGDINARPQSLVIKAFTADWVMLSDTLQHTFPADKPAETIDYIMGYRGNSYRYRLVATQVLDEPVASDHRPVVADVLAE